MPSSSQSLEFIPARVRWRGAPACAPGRAGGIASGRWMSRSMTPAAMRMASPTGVEALRGGDGLLTKLASVNFRRKRRKRHGVDGRSQLAGKHLGRGGRRPRW